jgi:hypothetical protein
VQPATDPYIRVPKTIFMYQRIISLKLECNWQYRYRNKTHYGANNKIRSIYFFGSLWKVAQR